MMTTPTSHAYKEEKYAPLIADLSLNYAVFHFSVEVSARGQVTKSNPIPIPARQKARGMDS